VAESDAAKTAQRPAPNAEDAKRDADTPIPTAAVIPVASPTNLAVDPKKSDSEPMKPVLKLDKTIVDANLQKSAGTPDEIELRIAATNAWLEQAGKNLYSIQLLGSDSPTQLKRHLNVIRKYIEINDIFVYRTIAKQKPSLTVLYGSFEDRRAALDAMAKLPEFLKAYKPVLRTTQGIRGEIARHQSS
jgi:septal ring-binding cell division protein DamX